MLNPNEPLGLPRGSVRGVLAILVVGSTVVDAIVNGAPNAALTGMAGSVLTWYFVKRDRADEEQEAPLPEGFLPGDEDE
jgi:hypothetical protein